METGQRVIFIHIPKTAGSSFAGILQSKFAPEKRFHVTAGSMITAKRYYEITNEILHDLDDRIVNNIQLLHGHIAFNHSPKYDDFSYITFLRDPIKRVISDYLFTKSTPTLPLYHIANSLTLKEYVTQNEELHLDNLQTRILSGKMKGKLQIKDLELAEVNLYKKFRFYGLTEYFDHSLIMLNRVFAWQISSYAIKNVTKTGNNNITDEMEIAIVKEYNAFDLQLYDGAKKRFMDVINSESSYFEKEVKKISRGNSKRKSNLAYSIFRKFKGMWK